MDLQYKVLAEHEGHQLHVTEVVFGEKESLQRQLFEMAIKGGLISYDSTVFPEHLVLLGTYEKSTIREMVRQQILPGPKRESWVPSRFYAEEINVSPDFL